MIFSEIIRQDQFCYETCVKNSDCNNREICLDGECQSGCTSDNHCPEGSKCFRKSCVTTCSRDTGMSSLLMWGKKKWNWIYILAHFKSSLLRQGQRLGLSRKCFWSIFRCQAQPEASLVITITIFLHMLSQIFFVLLSIGIP